MVSGGIYIRVKGEATPTRNCLYLIVGAVLANVLGTTGASMMLIRPWIRMNKYRITGFHIPFFIFIVSNVGGCLTPIGDPPLFLGYLLGVPFFWITAQTWPAWLVGVGLLVGLFYLFDRYNFVRAPREVRQRETAQETFGMMGAMNFIPLAAILVAVIVLPGGVREAVIIGCGDLFVPDHGETGARGEPLHLWADQGGRVALRGDLRHHGAGYRLPPGACGPDGDPRADEFLLDERLAERGAG